MVLVEVRAGRPSFRRLVLWVMHIVPLCLGLFGVFLAG
jgi:hypothetical protein